MSIPIAGRRVSYGTVNFIMNEYGIRNYLSVQADNIPIQRLIPEIIGIDQIARWRKEIGIRLRGNKCAGNDNRCYVPYKFGKQILIVQAFGSSFLNIYFSYGEIVKRQVFCPL